MTLNAEKQRDKAVDTSREMIKDSIIELRAEMRGLIEDKHKIILRVMRNETIDKV